MKGNKSQYILLPVVAIIWIVIGYRLFKYLDTGKPETHNIKAKEITFTPENNTPDTFSIVANYRDPFLGEVHEKKASSPTTTNQAKPLAKPAPKPIVKADPTYPKVVFHGLVRNNNSKKAYALISVDGKSKTVKEKDEINGLKILSITRDSVVTSFNKQVIGFGKK